MAEIALRKLADLEFDLVGDRGFNAARRAYLRLMRVTHGRQLRFGRDILIRNRGGLALGERCGIGSFSRIWNYAPITIGDDFLTAGGLTLNSGSHDPDTLQPRSRKITIGNRVWCGVNVTILENVTIGDDVVLGAGSVVVSDISPGCIAAGMPARPIRNLRRDHLTTLYSIFTPCQPEPAIRATDKGSS